jgi:hypothetical protein
MFDTPDLLPLCVAPFVGLFVGALAFAGVFAISTVLRQGPVQRRALLSFLAAFVVVPIACAGSVALRIGAWSPSPWFKPAAADIVGTWEFTQGTSEALTDWYGVQVPHHELLFLEDGTFRMRDVPSFWGVSEIADTGGDPYLDGSGTWQFDRLQGTERLEWIVRTEFEEINGKPDSREMRYYFQGHLPPYVLVTLDGDSLIFRLQQR